MLKDVGQLLNEARQMDKKIKHDPRIFRNDRSFINDTTEIMVKSVVVVAIPNELIRHECKAAGSSELNYRDLYDIAVRMKLTSAPPAVNKEFDEAGTRTIPAEKQNAAKE